MRLFSQTKNSWLATALKLGGLLAVPLTSTAALYFFQDRLVFNPTRTPAVTRPVGPGHRRRAVTLRMRDGVRLRGWWYRPSRSNPVSGPAVIYFGGRSEEVSWLSEISGTFAGANVLAVNYRGYGSSEGQPSENALFSDALELCDWLAAQAGVDPDRIALVGRSLGTGIAAFVAARRQIAAAVLITPYDSVLEIARRRFPLSPVRLLLRHTFASVTYAVATKTPVLVLMAERDDVVPHRHTLKLIDAWAGEKQVVHIPGTDHFDILSSARSWRAVRKFLRRRLAPAPLALPSPAPALVVVHAST